MLKANVLHLVFTNELCRTFIKMIMDRNRVVLWRIRMLFFILVNLFILILFLYVCTVFCFRYLSGLTPTEFFFHAMGGREGLIGELNK